MRVGRVIKWSLLAVLLAVVVAGAYIYIQINRPPADYRPARLPPEQRETEARRFIQGKLISPFNDDAEQPFDWTLTQEQASNALASADEIAFSLGGERDQVKQSLEQAGLADPAIVFRDGGLCLMIYSREFDKVLSAQVAFRVQDDGMLKVELADTQVGSLSMPKTFVRDRVQEVKNQLPPPPANGNGGFGQVKSKDLGKMLTTLIAAIDGEPITPEFVVPQTHRRMRVIAVTIAPGQLTLRLQPLPR